MKEVISTNPIREAAAEIAVKSVQYTEEEVAQAVADKLQAWGIHAGGTVENQLTRAVAEARTALFVEIAKHVTAKD